MHFETPHNKIECVLSVKESNFNERKGSKFSHLLTVRAEVADAPLPYGQPNCKIYPGFFDESPKPFIGLYEPVLYQAKCK